MGGSLDASLVTGRRRGARARVGAARGPRCAPATSIFLAGRHLRGHRALAFAMLGAGGLGPLRPGVVGRTPSPLAWASWLVWRGSSTTWPSNTASPPPSAAIRAVLDEATDVIRIIDSDTQRIVDINRADCVLSGCTSRGASSGRNRHDFWPDDPEARRTQETVTLPRRTPHRVLHDEALGVASATQGGARLPDRRHAPASRISGAALRDRRRGANAAARIAAEAADREAAAAARGHPPRPRRRARDPQPARRDPRISPAHAAAAWPPRPRKRDGYRQMIDASGAHPRRGRIGSTASIQASRRRRPSSSLRPDDARHPTLDRAAPGRAPAEPRPPPTARALTTRLFYGWVSSRRLPRPLHRLRHPVRLRRLLLRPARRVRLEPREPRRRLLPLRLRLLRLRLPRRPAHRPLGPARGDRVRRGAPRRRADRDEPRAAPLASLRALRARGRPRHVDRLRAVQRHRGAVVRAAPRARRRASPSAGGSLGTFVLPPAAHGLVARRSAGAAPTSPSAWRIFLVLNLVALLMRRDPESSGLSAGRGCSRARPSSPGGSGGGLRRRARRCARESFWMIFALFSATWIPVFVPVVHLVPHARDLGDRAAPRRHPGERARASAPSSGASPWAGSPTAWGGGPRSPSGSAPGRRASWASSARPRCPRCTRPRSPSASPTGASRRSSPPSSRTSSAARTRAALVGLLFAHRRAARRPRPAWPRAGSTIDTAATRSPGGSPPRFNLLALGLLALAQPPRPVAEASGGCPCPPTALARLGRPRAGHGTEPQANGLRQGGEHGGLKDKYCIVGVGETEYSRRSSRSTRAMAVEAIKKAMADAGLAQDQRGRDDVLPGRRLHPRQLGAPATSASGSTSTWT